MPLWDTDPHEPIKEEEVEHKPAKIYFEQPTIDEQTWIQSKAYKYGFSGANDLSRSEVANEDGEVKGTYTFPDADGEPILVRYKAGPNTGFVIENLDEVQQRTNPKDTSDESSSHHTSEQKHSYKSNPEKHESKPFVDPLAVENPDRSYQFSYGSNEEDASREEVSDSKGNIRGKYRFINSDGNTIEVKYSAGADKGFVIENKHELVSSVTKATHDATHETERKSKRRRVVKKLRRRKPSKSIKVNSDSLPSENDVPNVARVEHENNEDASYSFKVETEDSSREETSDKNGERFGSYRYAKINNGMGKKNLDTF